MLNPVLYNLFLPIAKVRGVGPKYQQAYHRLGIHSTLDLLYHLPVGIIDRSKIADLQTVKAGEIITQLVTVLEVVKPHNRKAPFKVIAESQTGTIRLLFFHYNKSLDEKFTIGRALALSGTVSKAEYGEVEIIHPDIVVEAAKLDEVCRVEPVYGATYGLTSRYIGKSIQNAISTMLPPNLPEWIDGDILAKYGWLSWCDSIKEVHNPKSLADLEAQARPRQRLAFDEILSEQISLMKLRAQRTVEIRPPLSFSGDLKQRLLELLPFELTSAQVEVVAQITDQQKSPHKMVRLIQGDVGAGKTIVAIIAMLNAYEAGKKAALMVPTELLALQHYQSLEKYCSQLGVKCYLYINNLKASARKEVEAALLSSTPCLVVGTHALFQAGVNFTDLALVIIDEQHRFGVEQRVKLINKGQNLDYIMMSATPIPRTLEMINNGDMEVSVLATKPAARLPIKTTITHEAKIMEVIAGIKRVIAKGEKIYWVCPLIEESESLNLNHLNDRLALLSEHFAGKVAMVHGKQSVGERSSAMASFVTGNISVLLATSVIEVGVDVPLATLIVIDNSERFGLAQLHQLRGRVGRSNLQSYCVLMYSNRISLQGKQRLQIMRESNDGFYIAEQDLKIRGGGEVLGDKQSGLPQFKIFDPMLQFSLLEDANQAAKRFWDTNGDKPLSKELDILSSLFANSEFRL
jgi:ATP-dependent DNA helicase RecG